MRRPSTLAVDTRISNDHDDDLYYDLALSPRSSIFSFETSSVSDLKHMPAAPPATAPVPLAPPVSQPPPPSIKLLFSLLSRRCVLCLLFPAVTSSVIAGGVAPFMTYVVGKAFEGFSRFPLGPNPPQAAKDALLRSVGMAALELVGLAVGSLALGSVTSSLWIWTGERNAMAVRKAVYRSIAQKDMVWFDTHLGDQEAGGMMAKLTRETDDVRMATSLASGYLIQYLTTTFACLILAFVRSWALTLVILSVVPLLIIIQSLSQSIVSPLIFRERSETSTTATLIDRALTAISTVKAFSAQDFELRRATRAFESLRIAARHLNGVWGVTSALAQFVMMAMFVQGFWFGSKLVRDGKVSSGDVMATFWACLIATSNLQMCIPQFITLAKGKFAMAALMETIHDSPSLSSSTLPKSPLPSTAVRSSVRSSFNQRRVSRRFRTQILRKITPMRCYGEFALHDVTFSYPSKPSTTVLSNVSLYLPANETTFIVGSSGSGKSTIAALLMRMYEPTSGTIMLDDQDVRYLDESWLRGQIAGVSQGFGGVVVLDGRTLRENVAVGACGKSGGPQMQVKNEEVEEACRMAMVHEFVKDLPDGYSTVLGSSSAATGVALSGGQRQRLALARARIRDPTILVLDEATSALDATSRILVFEAIKRWRKNKTTIVITHDLSQIQDQDFVYVLRNGRVVEQGYRADLERAAPLASPSPISTSFDNEGGEGEFLKMMESQRAMGGFPIKDLDAASDSDDHEELGVLQSSEPEEPVQKEVTERRLSLNTVRPLTFGNWMFDVIADLTSQFSTDPTPAAPKDAVATIHSSRPLSRFIPFPSTIREEGEEADEEAQYVRRPRRPSSTIFTPTTTTTVGRVVSRRYSLQFTPTSPTSTVFSQSWKQVGPKDVEQMQEEGEEENGEQFGERRDVLHGAGRFAAMTREKRSRNKSEITVRIPPSPPEAPPEDKNPTGQDETDQPPQFWQLLRRSWPTIPQKPLLVFGLFICLVSGSVTPIFSFLLSRLLFEVSIGAQNVSTINIFGAIVLSIAALDGILIGFKYYVMESVGMIWATHLRTVAYGKVLRQDKAWFDNSKNSPARLIQVIVKDGDDGRTLLSTVIGQCFVVLAMLSVGLLWAMVKGWELTLVGLGIAPIFAGAMAIQTKLVGKCEVKNKRAREEVARGWYDVMCNIKGIRAMGIARPFADSFNLSVERALDTGVKGAWVEGGTHGVANGLIYGAEAVLFYVGAVLVANGRYSYLQMIEVLNLVVFSVSIGSQIMAFTEKIAKSTQATHDLLTLTELSTHDTSESKGLLKPSPSLLTSGPIVFDQVSFTYPSRPEILTLNNFNLRIDRGECIALVGASGSGKSTVASLLQRLYEPFEGRIRFGDIDIKEVDVQRLRSGLGVVSQAPQLFEGASVEDNILYGISPVAFADEAQREQVVQRVARLANIDWLDNVEGGLKAPLGEVSGGQAQRIQIARALVRSGVHLLILDECTSALDVENQRQVLETIVNVRRAAAEEGRGLKMVVITHKAEVMQMCDRVVVVRDGQVCEEGAYEDLIEKKGGVFRELARGGVWEA